jgi:hypothetical protein
VEFMTLMWFDSLDSVNPSRGECMGARLYLPRRPLLRISKGALCGQRIRRGFRMDSVMFLDCPEYMDRHGTVRCGLPTAVEYRYTMQSTDGPLESVKIRCPRGHCFNGPLGSLTWEKAGYVHPRAAGIPEQGAAARGDGSHRA